MAANILVMVIGCCLQGIYMHAVSPQFINDNINIRQFRAYYA